MNSYGEVTTKVPKFGTTRLKSLLRSIPRTRSRPGGDTFPSGLLYKPLFIVMSGHPHPGEVDVEVPDIPAGPATGGYATCAGGEHQTSRA